MLNLEAVRAEQPATAVVVQFLCLSGGPLGASAYQQSHRVHVRHGTVADQADEEMRVADGNPDDGVEVGVGGRDHLAPTDGLQTHTAGEMHPQRTHGAASSATGSEDDGARDNASSTTLDTILFARRKRSELLFQ